MDSLCQIELGMTWFERKACLPFLSAKVVPLLSEELLFLYQRKFGRYFRVTKSRQVMQLEEMSVEVMQLEEMSVEVPQLEEMSVEVMSIAVFGCIVEKKALCFSIETVSVGG